MGGGETRDGSSEADVDAAAAAATDVAFLDPQTVAAASAEQSGDEQVDENDAAAEAVEAEADPGLETVETVKAAADVTGEAEAGEVEAGLAVLTLAVAASPTVEGQEEVQSLQVDSAVPASTAREQLDGSGDSSCSSNGGASSTVEVPTGC